MAVARAEAGSVAASARSKSQSIELEGCEAKAVAVFATASTQSSQGIQSASCSEFGLGSKENLCLGSRRSTGFQVLIGCSAFISLETQKPCINHLEYSLTQLSSQLQALSALEVWWPSSE